MTNPGSADALRKALEDAQSFISGFVARTEYDTGKPWVGGNEKLEQIRAALSADAALSQGKDPLRDISRALRDDMVLQNVTDSGKRLTATIDRQLWNDWAEAIGDLAVPSLSQQVVVETRATFTAYRNTAGVLEPTVCECGWIKAAHEGDFCPTRKSAAPQAQVTEDGKCDGGMVPTLDGSPCKKCGATENDNCQYAIASHSAGGAVK